MNSQSAKIAVVLDKMPGLPAGGGHAVGAWTVEALQGNYDVTIIAPDPNLSVLELNAFFGTSLRSKEVRIEHVSMPLVLHRTQRLGLLKKHLLLRYCARIAKEYDLIIYSSGEADFGLRGIQYIHFPADGSDANRGILLGIYEKLCRGISGYSFHGLRTNITLTNSQWTAEAIRRVYNLEPLVLYPPVPNDYPSVPWESRENGFLCIGRIARDKQLERVINILRRVREQGWNIHLHLIGEFHDRKYWKSLSRLVNREMDWVSAEGPMPRAELVRFLVSHKYGLHGMPNEHFGIAIGEMVKAGCIVFVPNDGGQLEIVNDERLTYQDETGAVERICAVLGSEELQLDLITSLALSSNRFSPATFVEGVRKVVQIFLEEKADRFHALPSISASSGLS